MGKERVTVELRGVTLRRRLKEQGPFLLEQASVLIDQLAEAVDHLHGRGIAHGAVCPDNIWILLDGSVRLYTGGSAARYLMQEAGYISPEELRGEPISRVTDIWALGALLQEMLTGNAPTPGMTASNAPRLMDEDACAQAIIDRAIEDSSQKRFHSAQQMANALWECLPNPAPDASHPRRSSAEQEDTTEGMRGLHECVNRSLRLSDDPPVPVSPRSRPPSIFGRLRARREPPARHVGFLGIVQRLAPLDIGFPG